LLRDFAETAGLRYKVAMMRDHRQARAYRRLGLALAAASVLWAPQAMADIPTTIMTADGGPVAPPPKSNARPEQRTTEQRPATAPSLG